MALLETVNGLVLKALPEGLNGLNGLSGKYVFSRSQAFMAWYEFSNLRTC